ncbi:hypothetical protein ACFFX0_03200 [Citricoccus parietis]|uniref:Uncharacterized protein n=1 Tax=Citricoccus parietis TaxID=592307 RepID=A0ABV5FU87_9MICC
MANTSPWSSTRRTTSTKPWPERHEPADSFLPLAHRSAGADSGNWRHGH